MTKAEFHELAVSIWQAGNTNSLKRPDYREVDLLAEIARDGIMRQFMDEGADLMDEFYTPFVIDVLFDNARNQKYSNLPSDVSDFKEALIMISPVQNEEEQFIHQLRGDDWLFKGLEAENSEGQPSFKIEGKKVRYKNIPDQYSQVLVMMVVDIVGLPETATFPVPQMFEQQVLDYVLSKLQIQETVPLKDEEKP